MFGRVSSKNPQNCKTLSLLPSSDSKHFLCSEKTLYRPAKKDSESTKQQILDELKSEPEERKTMPALFYGVAAIIVFLMYYLQYITKAPQKTEGKPIIKVMGEAKIGGN
jgi:hypothetical protein